MSRAERESGEEDCRWVRGEAERERGREGRTGEGINDGRNDRPSSGLDVEEALRE